MSDTLLNKLDNPAWYSLLETHKHFALGDEEIKRYPENIAPFVAFSLRKVFSKFILKEIVRVGFA